MNAFYSIVVLVFGNTVSITFSTNASFLQLGVQYIYIYIYRSGRSHSQHRKFQRWHTEYRESQQSEVIVLIKFHIAWRSVLLPFRLLHFGIVRHTIELNLNERFSYRLE